MGPIRVLIESESVLNFINEVKKRECIWNQDYVKYNDRYETMVAWKEISILLDIPEVLLKSRWKNLRDLFRREIKQQKRKHKKCESLDDYKGKWQFFKPMWFMQKPEDLACNEIEDEVIAETMFVDDENNPLDTFVKCEPADMVDEQLFIEVEPEAPGSRRKRKREENRDDCDFDMMFLKSLTPYLRELDPMRKLVARSKIQDILINELGAQQAQNSKINKSNS